MTQVNVDGYDVILVKGAPRFRLNKRLVARDKVPMAIQEELINIANDKEAVRVVAAAPDKATETVETVGFVETTESDDGDVPPYTDLELELLEKVDTLQRELSGGSVAPALKPTVATPEELGQELLDNYGIYTALANRDPELGDIHPMTLAHMNRYDTGLAYVARKTARNSLIELKPAVESVEQPNPTSKQAEASGHQSFADRTGVSFRGESSMHTRQRPNDPISEEAYPEPILHGTTIRPYW